MSNYVKHVLISAERCPISAELTNCLQCQNMIYITEVIIVCLIGEITINPLSVSYNDTLAMGHVYKITKLTCYNILGQRCCIFL